MSWGRRQKHGDARCGDCEYTSRPGCLRPCYADGRCFSTRGWGYDGPIAYSDDGEQWTKAPFEVRWNGLAARSGCSTAGLSVLPRPASLHERRRETFEDRTTVGHGGQVRGDVYALDGKLMINDDGDVRVRTRRPGPHLDLGSRGRGLHAAHAADQGGSPRRQGRARLINSLNGVVCRSPIPAPRSASRRS